MLFRSPIPCPHFQITITQRSKGQSAVAGAALVGCACHCRLSLAALGDGNLKMRTRNGYHLQNKNRPSGLLLTNGLESYSVVLSVHGGSGVRFGPGRELQKDSCEAAQGKCSFPWDGIGMADGNASPVSSSRLQDRNFTGTVYNCALLQ